MSDRTRTSLFSGRQFSLVILGVIAVVAIVAGSWQWWNDSSLNPQSVFWGMMQNNLSTQGVTVTQASSNSGTNTTQINQFDFGPDKRAATITTFVQGAAEVRTLELSTPSADYTKYLSIKTGQSKDNSVVNKSNVLNVWANTTASTKSKDPNVPSTFPTILLSLALPVGSFSPTEQNTLISEMKTQGVYTPSFSSVKKQTKNGRLQYVYSVSMQPILYVQLMKDYARALGMHELDSVDPNNYQSNEVTTMQWTIDARSRQLVEVSYDGHSETYSGFGAQIQTATPTKTISGNTLQQRVNALNAKLKS